MEELILLSPHNHLYHLKYAMILYTMGGLENLTLAKTYYCKVLDLNKDNTHALIGLHLTCKSLSARTPNVAELTSFAAERLKEKYQDKDVAKEVRDAVNTVLDQKDS